MKWHNFCTYTWDSQLWNTQVFRNFFFPFQEKKKKKKKKKMKKKKKSNNNNNVCYNKTLMHAHTFATMHSIRQSGFLFYYHFFRKKKKKKKTKNRGSDFCFVKFVLFYPVRKKKKRKKKRKEKRFFKFINCCLFWKFYFLEFIFCFS